MPEYPDGIDVKRIGDAYFISKPYAGGRKHMQLTEREMRELQAKVSATLANPARYQINGKSTSRTGAKYTKLP